jgi:hypothetical protein
MPDLAEANSLRGDTTEPPASLLVGFDVLGGRFEINGPDPTTLGRPGAPGEMCYFAPDTLHWESLGGGHGAWLSWIAAGGIAQFYAHLRWPGWEDETHQLTADQGIAVYPCLWSAEARADLAGTARWPMPIQELFSLNIDTASHLAAPP